MNIRLIGLCIVLFGLYPNNMKNWNLGCAKTPGLIDRKRPNIRNMGSFTIDQSREFSRQPKSNSSCCLGIASLYGGGIAYPNPQTCIWEFDFEKGFEGWQGAFSDYPVGAEEFYELNWGWERLPKKVDGLSKGLYLSGNNHSDDLFMFVKHKVTSLVPNHVYDLEFKVTIESDVGLGMVGIGGSPGESVHFKVGASKEEPVPVNHNGYYLLNVDKGNQAQDGMNGKVIGNLANPAVNAEHPEYFPKELSTIHPLRVQADSSGAFWIFLGTDSGFEGTTKFYLAKVILVCY